ncbi:hypothetical protein D3C86_1065650 [compost metagenome]
MSTTKFQMPVGVLVWPTGLVDVAVMLCVPSASAVSGVKLHLPSASATTWPSSFVPSYTLMVLPACAVPMMVGLASSVTWPFCSMPWSTPTSSCTFWITGSLGGTLSRITVYDALGAVALPAGSTSIAVNSLLPCSSGVLTCSVHLPLASTVASPSLRVPVLSLTITMMVSPAVPVPLIAGRLSSVFSPGATLPCTRPTSSATPVIDSLLGSGGV